MVTSSSSVPSPSLPPAVSLSTSHAPRNAGRILLVDADIAAHNTLHRALWVRRFDVARAWSAAQALELARPDHALIVCATTLPDGRGFDLAHALRRERECRAPIVWLSFCPDAQSAAELPEALRLGAAYVRKPFLMDDLMEQVQSLLPPG